MFQQLLFAEVGQFQQSKRQSIHGKTWEVEAWKQFCVAMQTEICAPLPAVCLLSETVTADFRIVTPLLTIARICKIYI